VLLGWWLLSEEVGLRTGVAAAAIVGGVVMIVRAGRTS
jgi:drug/metabolite transporter (DMT)-like permease